MVRDFTYGIYKTLLQAYLEKGYALISYKTYIKTPPKKYVILRHDVDKSPQNSLRTAQIEKELSACGSYYFRSVKQSFQPTYIKQIAALGHEIGYHYEELALTKGDHDSAIKRFEKNLSALREFYPVKTMCMHGSPLSKWDNKLLWEKNNYKDYGIIAEPYFDIDFSKVLYLTDTGRSWATNKANVRDKVDSGFNIRVKTTADLIDAIRNEKLPNQIMQNIHPQRWNDNLFFWAKELVAQNAKNVVKAAIAK